MLPRPFAQSVACAAAAFLLAASARADVFYVTDSDADTVFRINRAGAATALPSTPGDLANPQQVAFDSAGNAYVADSSLGKVVKYAPGSASGEQIGNDVPGAISLAFSPAGVLHVASATTDTVQKLNGNDFQVLATLPGSALIRSVAFDTNGELYVADSAGSRVFKITPQGGQSVYSSAVTAPFAVAFDNAGKIHVTDSQEGGRIASFTGNGNNSRTVLGSLGDARGLVFDQGNVPYYVNGAGELRRVNITTTATTSQLIADGLGNVHLLTARAPLLSTVAFKTQTVPAANGAAIGGLATPAIGDGKVAFKSSLVVAGTVTSANSLAMFRSQAGGSLDLLARKSFPAPGFTGDAIPVINSFADPVMNNAGRVAFVGTLRTGVANVTSANHIAVFSDFDGGALRPVLRRGQANLGNGLDPLVKFTAFKQLVLPDDSGPAVLATIAGPGVTSSNALGLWSVDLAGNPSLVLRAGTMITTGGKARKLTTITAFKGTPLSLGQARSFGANQTFTVGAKFSDGFTAILRVKPGMDPEVLVEKASEVGAAIPSAKFAAFGIPAMADDATLAFRGVLTPLAGVVSTASAAAIFARDVTNEKVARAGESAPGVDGAFFASLSDPVASPAGGIAFFAKMKPGFGNVSTSTLAGLWQDLGTGVIKAVRQGEPAPGVSGATRFTGFKQFVLPATGGVVFTASIAGEGITTANNLGVWANDGAGATELLLRKGTKMLIGGKMRTVTGFKIFTAAVGVTGQSRSFDASGTVAVHVICSDATQAILMIQRP